MSALAAARRFLDRLALLDDEAVFISTRDPDQLLDAAAELDGREGELPLKGIVFAVKDNIDVAGQPTTAACAAFAYVPESSAPVVEDLEAAGALFVGKTNLDQFATGLVGTRSPYGTPVNPLRPDLVPGGSSSGSAVAVALGLVDFALATDTAGSGRVPAALCGIVGLKPTPGRLSTRGVVPAVRSIDCVAVMARTSAVARAVLRHADRFDPGDEFARRPGPHRPMNAVPVVGTVDVSTLEALGCSTEVVDGYLAACAGLGASCRTTTMDLGPFLELGKALYGGPWLAERTSAVGEFIAAHRYECDPIVAETILAGGRYSAVELHEARYERARLVRAIESRFADLDGLVLPTVPVLPTLAEVQADPVEVNAALGTFTTFANLADLCGLSVPVDTPQVDPIGVTIYAPAWCEHDLFRLSAMLSGDVDGGPAGSESRVRLVVAGAHLRGQPLDHQLHDLGAEWEMTTQTSPTYRLYALADSAPPKPGLVHDPTGSAIEVDTWLLDLEALGSFLTMIPAPLALGTVTLADGSTAVGFVCEPRALHGATDITEHGGWRKYVVAGR